MENDELIHKIEARRGWERARQAALIEEMLGLFSVKSSTLLSFEEVRKNLRLNQKNYKGMFEIPVDQIRGSVGRYRDFTLKFLPRFDEMQSRWERVDTVVMARGLEPIEVYQVGDAYFVLDGNHRVSVARSSQTKKILAHVYEFPTPVGLSAEADLDELLIKTEYADFLEATHLDVLRPEQHIEFTTPGRYREIEVQIGLYRQALETIDEEPISLEDAVTAWYDMIYTPAVQIIQQSGIMGHFAGRTEADLFAWIWRHHRDLPTLYHGRTLASTIDELLRQSERGLIGRAWDNVSGFFRRAEGKKKAPSP